MAWGRSGGVVAPQDDDPGLVRDPREPATTEERADRRRLVLVGEDEDSVTGGRCAPVAEAGAEGEERNQLPVRQELETGVEGDPAREVRMCPDEPIRVRLVREDP